MEIIFYWCGGAEVILNGPTSSIPNLFSAVSESSIPHQKCGSAPMRAAEVPTSGRQWQKKIGVGMLRSLRLKNFNFVEFYFKIPAGYKNMTNCLITLCREALFVAFLRGARSGHSARSLLDPSLLVPPYFERL